MSIGSVYETAYKGDFNQVKVKIDDNVDLVKEVDSNNRLLIHWASLGGNENLVDFLIDCGSPVDPCDDTNSTPLLLAASAGRLEVLRLLIGKRGNVNCKTARGQSALHYSCSKGHLQVTKLLLEADAHVNERDVLGATPLHRAAAQGRNTIVKLLLLHPDINLDLCDTTGSTPLHLACEENRDEVAAMLVKAGCNTQIQNKEKKLAFELCTVQLRNMLEALVN